MHHRHEDRGIACVTIAAVASVDENGFRDVDRRGGRVRALLDPDGVVADGRAPVDGALNAVESRGPGLSRCVVAVERNVEGGRVRKRTGSDHERQNCVDDAAGFALHHILPDPSVCRGLLMPSQRIRGDAASKSQAHLNSVSFPRTSFRVSMRKAGRKGKHFLASWARFFGTFHPDSRRPHATAVHQIDTYCGDNSTICVTIIPHSGATKKKVGNLAFC